jgi:hypothetical protein
MSENLTSEFRKMFFHEAARRSTKRDKKAELSLREGNVLFLQVVQERGLALV